MRRVPGVCVDEATGEAFAVPTRCRPPVLYLRQVQVLQGLAEGLSYAEIGGRLHIEKVTVSLTAGRLYRRLGASNGPHAVHLGHRLGLLS